MKIALVCLNLSWQAGGVRLLYEEAHALKRLGHAVTLYTPEFDENVYPELWKGLDIKVVSTTIDWQYRSSNLITRIFEKLTRERQLITAAERIASTMDSDFDLVNVHDFAYTTARTYRRRNPGAKIVWYVCDPPYSYLPKDNFFYDRLSWAFNAYKDLTQRKYFQDIDVAVTLVKGMEDWLKKRGIASKISWTGINFPEFFVPVR